MCERREGALGEIEEVGELMKHAPKLTGVEGVDENQN
jgi:hypothetical protein